MAKFKTILSTALLLVMAGTICDTAGAQDSKDRRKLYDSDGVFVYAVYYRVPWARVDSLIQVTSKFNALVEKGKEMGCWVDREFLIHHTGGVYNVIDKIYRTEMHFPNQDPGCGNRAWKATVPDDEERASLDAGTGWVLDGVEHYDEVYWEPYPSH